MAGPGRLENPVIIAGFTELERSLKASSPRMLEALRIGLAEAAEPVRRDADSLARSELSGMERARIKPPPWSVNKVGQTTKEVYVVPTEKGKRRGRTDGDRRRATKFVSLMLGKSYDPAFERNRVQIINTANHAIGSVTRTL